MFAVLLQEHEEVHTEMFSQNIYSGSQRASVNNYYLNFFTLDTIGLCCNSMATNSIILILVLSISCLCSTRDVYIQPSESDHCPGICYNINTFGKMAEHFSWLGSSFHGGNSLLYLQKLMIFMNLTNAVFEGDGRMEQGFHETVWQSTVAIKCTENSSSGIAFVNSFNITFRYITITNCGADMTSICQSKLFRNGSLGYFNIGYKIAIDHLSIQNGTGNGLLIETDEADLIITDSSFAQNYIYGHFDGSNIAILHAEALNCDPRSNLHHVLMLSTNVSFGDSELGSMGGISILMFQKSYSIIILLDSVIAYGNKGIGNIYIAAAEHDVPNYNLTINNSLISCANITSFALAITTINAQYKQCLATKNTLLDSTISIVNSKFTYNYNSGDTSAIVSIDATGVTHHVTFTKRIIIQSTEICHNIGFVLDLRHISYQYQTLFFVTLENFIANNNSLPNHGSGPETVIFAVLITSLVLKNVSITNNNMTGLAAYQTAVVVNGTSVFYNNTGNNGGGLAMYGNSYLVFYEILPLISPITVQSTEEEQYFLILSWN